MNYPHDLYLTYSSPIILSERGIPFCGNKGFPTLCPCYVTHLEFNIKTMYGILVHTEPHISPLKSISS